MPRKNYFFICCIKSIVAFTMLCIWYGTQFLLNFYKLRMGGIAFDRGHFWLSSVNDFLHHHNNLANAILIITSADIDISLICLFFWGIFGNTFRPTITIFLLLIFRQISQVLVSEPIPSGMIWHYPGFPSLIVTYFTTYDFFFSGHTATATIAALEIGYRNLKSKIYLMISILMVIIQVFFILSMRFHYTADAITGIFAAVTAFFISLKITPYVDNAFKIDPI